MNRQRSPSRFLIVSGTYLFVILLLNSMQPGAGFPPDADVIGLRNFFFLPVWAGIAIVAVLCRKIKEKNGGKELISAKVVFGTLILSVMAGFLLHVDDQRQVGCFGHDEPALSPVKCIVGGISIALLSLGYVFSNRKAGLVLLILELILWTLKALVCYNSSLDLIFSGYVTVICWSLRLVLIMKFLVKDQSPVSASA